MREPENHSLTWIITSHNKTASLKIRILCDSVMAQTFAKKKKNKWSIVFLKSASK